MKKNLPFLALIILLPSLLMAQITITQSDYAGVGTTLNLVTDGSPDSTINPGDPADTAQIWDFSKLKTNSPVQLNFIDPAATSYASKFPLANLCGSLAINDNFYYNKSESSVLLWGMSADITGNGNVYAVAYNNPETIMPFPSTYNTSFTDTSYFNRTFYYGQVVNYNGTDYNVDSVRYKERNYITSTIDAWGTVITPDGNFPALRQNIQKQTIDTVEIMVKISIFTFWYPISISTVNSHSYAFLAKNVGNALVTVKNYPSDTAEVDWTRATPEAVTEIRPDNNILIYPSLASDMLHINTTVDSPVNIAIYDITGREIMKTGYINDNLISLPVRIIDNGIYLVKIFNNTGLIKSGKIMISH